MAPQARGFAPGNMQISGDEIQETLRQKRDGLNSMQAQAAAMPLGTERDNLNNLADLAKRNLRDASAASMTARTGGSLGSLNSDMNGVLAFDYARHKAKGFKSGGVIRGPGTGTSDSIAGDMRPGTFIMPADSTKAIGPEVLKNIAKVPVRVSNGEFEFTPEQVQSVGSAVLSALKDATHEPVEQHAEGGIVGRMQTRGPGKKEYNEKFAFGPGTGRAMAPYDFTTGYGNRGYRDNLAHGGSVKPQRLFGGGSVAFGGLADNVQRAGYGDAEEAEGIRQRGMRFNATLARDQRRIDRWEEAQSPEGRLKAAQAMDELIRFTSPKSRLLRDWDTEQRYRSMQQQNFQQTGYIFADGGTVRGFSPRDAVQYFDDGGKVRRLDEQVYPPGSRGARLLEQELQKAQDREATGRAIVDAVKAPFGNGTAQPAQSMYAPDAVTAEPPNPTDQRLAQGKQQSPAMPPPAKTAAPQANAQAESANVGVGNMGREGMTNAQVGAANPQGRIKVERQANGTLSLSGTDVRGDPSYTDASGNPLAGGGLRGKGFGRFVVAPAGAHVAMGPNGSYAFANEAPAKRAVPQSSDPSQARGFAPGMSAEQMAQYARDVEAARANMVGNQIVANARGNQAVRDWNDLRSPVGIARRNLEFDMNNGPIDRSLSGKSGGAGGGGASVAQQAAADVYRNLARSQFGTAGGEAQTAAEQQRWQYEAERKAAADAAAQEMANRKYGLQAGELDMRREAAGFQTRAAKRLEDAQLAYDAAKTPEERASAAQRLRDLQGKTTNPKDDLVVVGGGQEWDANAGAMRNVPQRVFDARTRQWVDGGREAAQALPPGMKRQIGTANGRPVYEDMNGNRVIAKG